MKIVVIIPTYNEAQNIGRMIEALSTVFPKIKQDEMALLVVDGNSPDGTADVVNKYKEKFPWLYLLIEESKKGIGAAYFNGFEHAINNMGAEAVVEMDGDFQHDPEALPALVAPLSEGYDYVIGSRFVKGGSIPADWAFYRKFLSIGGSIFTKVVLGIYSVDDFTSGFKASRVHGFLDKIDTSKITGNFAYKIHMLYLMYKAGAKIKQIPIQFGLRNRGSSKMEGDNFWVSLKTVLGIKLYEKKEFVKFCVVGGTGFVVDAGLFNTFIFASVAPQLAAIISGFVAMTVTFTLNNSWSFKGRTKIAFSDIIKSFPPYVVVSLVPIFLRSKLVHYASIAYSGNFIFVNAAFLLGIVFGLIWNYLIYSRVIWRRKK